MLRLVGMVAAVLLAAYVPASSALRQLSQHIGHFEPLHLDADEWETAHRTYRRDARLNDDSVLSMDFSAFGKSFHLRMQRHSSLFAPDATFTAIHADGSKHPIPYDKTRHYKGTIQGRSGFTAAYASLHDGVFDGLIRDNDGEFYHVEPSRRYLAGGKAGGLLREAGTSFSHVVYRFSDVVANLSHSFCGSVNAETGNAKMSPLSDLHDRLYKNKGTANDIWAPILDDDEEGEHFVQKAIKSSDDVPSESSKDPVTMARRAVACTSTLTEPSCNFDLVSDHTFFDHQGNEANTINEMVAHLTGAEVIFAATEFGTGAPTMELAVRSLTVITSVLTAPGNAFPESETVNELLESFAVYGASNDFNGVCLGHLFVDRDFSGTLGLAYVGSTSTIGGVCQNSASLSFGTANTNTGLTSINNNGATNARSLSILTTAHEIGHNYGSPHDSTAACTPSGASGGKFLMYAFATSGTNPNNDNFSECSRQSICEVLNAKASPCFTPTVGQTCGDVIVEAPEECDCGVPILGNAATCTAVDACCAPGCNYTSGAVCSPRADACCETNCTFSSASEPCAAETDCLLPSSCTGTDKNCPDQVPKADNTNCNCRSNQTVCSQVCDTGVCDKSQCQLLTTPTPPCLCAAGTDAVKLCCNDTVSGCVPYDTLVGNLGLVYLSVGAACNGADGETGFVSSDAIPECNVPDNNSLLDNLLPFLQDALNWIKKNWYWVLAGFLGLMLLVIAVRYTYRKRSPEEIQRETDERRRREAQKRGVAVPKSGGGHHPRHENIPMQQMRSDGSRGQPHQQQQRQQQGQPKSKSAASGAAAPVPRSGGGGGAPQMTKEQSYTALKRGFPKVDDRIIRQVLEANHWDARAAIKKLMQMGYKPDVARH
jgi:disintegrin and metalloproteinase domain-containing protein 10